MKNSFKIRPATLEDVNAAAEIFLNSFNGFNATVGLPPEWPNLEFCQGIVGSIISNPGFYSIVAEDNFGKIIGSNFLEKHDEVTAPGPISVLEGTQNTGVGRALMQDVIDFSYGIGKNKIRLVQVANNLKSYGLYASLGFEPRETLTALTGYIPQDGKFPNNDLTVRTMQVGDVDECNELHKAANFTSRKNDILGAMHPNSPHDPYVITNSTGKILGYTTGLFLLGHTVCTTTEVFKILISVVSSFMKNKNQAAPPPLIHLPSRMYPEVLKWALGGARLKILRQEIMMTMGEYKVYSSGIYCPGMAY